MTITDAPFSARKPHLKRIKIRPLRAYATSPRTQLAHNAARSLTSRRPSNPDARRGCLYLPLRPSGGTGCRLARVVDTLRPSLPSLPWIISLALSLPTTANYAAKFSRATPVAQGTKVATFTIAAKRETASTSDVQHRRKSKGLHDVPHKRPWMVDRTDFLIRPHPPIPPTALASSQSRRFDHHAAVGVFSRCHPRTPRVVLVGELDQRPVTRIGRQIVRRQTRRNGRELDRPPDRDSRTPARTPPPDCGG